MDQTREIPREEWEKYLALLSQKEKAHPVHIEVEGAELGNQPLAERMPLASITLVKKGSDLGSIEVMLGETGTEFMHRITAPEHVYAEESEGGELKSLDIEDQSNAKTLISFYCQEMPHPSVPPY